ncbi:MAG: hypothetical protein AAGC55_04435 [Myxococcota bacterium]
MVILAGPGCGSDSSDPIIEPDGSPEILPRCGNGTLEVGEECEEGDLGAFATCGELGYPGSETLSCNPLTCTYDTSDCIRHTLKNHDDACAARVSCPDPLSPRRLVECFDTEQLSPALPPPFLVTDISYQIVATPDIPNPTTPYSIGVYTRLPETGGPGELIGTVPMTVENISVGPHQVTLAAPIEVATSSFCLGVVATEGQDVYSLGMSSTAPGTMEAWGDCDGDGIFTNIVSAVPELTTGNLCITATVDRL